MRVCTGGRRHNACRPKQVPGHAYFPAHRSDRRAHMASSIRRSRICRRLAGTRAATLLGQAHERQGYGTCIKSCADAFPASARVRSYSGRSRQHSATGRLVTAKPLLLASMLRDVSVEEVVEFAVACERQLLADTV